MVNIVSSFRAALTEFRAHLLRDLRPYMCTYEHCQQSDELFATKQDWLNHEHTHQKAWQCPEHASAHFTTQDGLKKHLLAETHETLQRMGLEDLLAICETVRPDSRTICPICFVEAGSSFGLENHLANHLERFAAFALPRDVEGDADEESPNNSNMSEHAIERSDQSEVSNVSYAFAGEDKKAEAEELATETMRTMLFSDADTNPLDKLYDQITRIVNLPTAVLDKLNIDLQFKAVFKTIPKLLTELREVGVSGIDEDVRECTSELIFQMERLDSILQEYATEYALDSSHPRLGIDTVLSDQSLEDGRKQNQPDEETAPSRESSPDSVVNRTGPRLSTMDLNRHRTSDSAEEATSPIRYSSPDSIVNRTSSILSTMDLNRFQTSNPDEDDVSTTRDSSLDSPVGRKALDNVIANASTGIHDTTLGKTDFESFCRKQLSTYEVFTLRPNQDKIKSKMEDRWAKVDIIQKSHPTKQIIRAIRELDAGPPSIIEKKALLFPNQKAQVTNILSNKIMNEREGQFEWVLAQLYCEEAVNLKTGKKETASMTIYLKRAPLPGIDVTHLYRERQERAHIEGSHRQQAHISQQVQATQQQQQESHEGQATEIDLKGETKPNISNNGKGDNLTEELPGENMRRNSFPFLIATLTSLLNDAHRIQQRLQDIATEDKVTSNSLVILNRIFPGICLAITSLITMLRESDPDFSIVPFIETTNRRCQRLFEDASNFLGWYNKSTPLGWGSQKRYQEDKEQLVASAQRVEQRINYIHELHARGRTSRIHGHDQDEPIPPPSTETRTLTTDNVEAKGGFSREFEYNQRPESARNSQDTDDIQIPGLEDGSKVGHETSELSKSIAGQRDSSSPTHHTPPRNLDSNSRVNRPIIIDERHMRGILKPGRNKFPEDPSPTRKGVAPLGDAVNDGIYIRPSRAEAAPPPGARWTKINRLLVNPGALDEGGERYEARDDFVIVLRVLSKEEIQAYADATVRIRG